MLKYSSFILLLAVTVFWSQVDSKPRPGLPWECNPGSGPCKRSPAWAPIKRSPAWAPVKRETSGEIEDVELSQETQEKLVKELLVGLLLVTADNSAEEKVLSEKFNKALETKYDSLDDFGNDVVDIYEEVTGKKTAETDESD